MKEYAPFTVGNSGEQSAYQGDLIEENREWILDWMGWKDRWKKRTNRTIRRGGKCSNNNSSEEVGPFAIDAVGWWWNNGLNRDADMQYRKVFELGSGDVKRKREKKKDEKGGF